MTITYNELTIIKISRTLSQSRSVGWVHELISRTHDGVIWISPTVSSKCYNELSIIKNSRTLSQSRCVGWVHELMMGSSEYHQLYHLNVTDTNCCPIFMIYTRMNHGYQMSRTLYHPNTTNSLFIKHHQLSIILLWQTLSQ